MKAGTYLENTSIGSRFEILKKNAAHHGWAAENFGFLDRLI